MNALLAQADHLVKIDAAEFFRQRGIIRKPVIIVIKTGKIVLEFLRSIGGITGFMTPKF